MSSYVLIANGQHNPFLATPLPEHMIYPISQHSNQGIDLDYTALLIGEQFVMYSVVYEDIINTRKDFLKPMKKSLLELSASGLLVQRDFNSVFNKHKNEIVEKTELQLENYEIWLALAQEQWKTLSGELSNFHKDYGSYNMRNENISNISIESWLERSNQKYNTELREKLYNLFEGKIKIEDVEIENIKGSLQFIIAQILMSDLISENLSTPTLDWDDSAKMYQRIFSYKWSNYSKDNKIYENSFKLFNVVMPSLRPDNIDSVIKFIKHKNNVSTLRNTIIDSIDNGEIINDKWWNNYSNELIRNNLTVSKKANIFQYIGGVASLIPGARWGSALVTGGFSLAGETLFNPKKKYKWYYTLQKIK